MNEITKRLEQAIIVARAMTPEQQDLLAVKIMERAREFNASPTKLSPQERAELEAGLAAARLGEFASDSEVAAVFAKHGL